jgi:hypothetical protein
MANVLTHLPDQFAAGTTVIYRRQLADYLPSNGWTLKVHLAGACVLARTAVPDGDDFIVTLAAIDTAGDFEPGLYRWVERVSHPDGEVYQIDQGQVRILPNLAEASCGSDQEWIEKAIKVLRAHIEGRLPAGMESYQLAGRVVAKMPIKDAVSLLSTFESRLARLENPDFVTRQVQVSFTPPGLER